MKLTTLFATAAGAVALCLSPLTEVASANMLANPGFEVDAVLDAAPSPTVTDWNPLGAASTASANTDPVRSGIGSLRLDGAGNFSVPTARQEFAVTPGDIVNLQGYHLTQTALPADATFHLFKLVWEDASGAEINPVENDPNLIGGILLDTNPGVESTPFLNSGSDVGVWNFSEVQGTAPANAASVVLLGGLLVDQSAATVWVDDLSATITSVPEPASALLALLGTVGVVGRRRRD